MQAVKVILKDGTTTTLDAWQKLYGLPVGSDKIGIYYSLKDPQLVKELKEYGELVVNELLIRVLDAYRELKGKPNTINAFNRNEAHQKELFQRGYRTAVFSPHVVKMAADNDTVTNAETDSCVKLFQEVSKNLGIAIRIGYKEYKQLKQTFIHVDVCPEYYAKGKPYYSQPHPPAWEMAGLTW